MRVAIIGGGASGLTALKECLDEGLDAVILEKDHTFGGLWRFADEVGKGGTVYRSTIINTSKEMMCYSDFPLPKDYSPFMHNTYVIKYFDMYAKKFDLHKHIRYNIYVHNVKQAADYDQTGKWDLELGCADDPSGEKTIETFDAVLVCSGHHWDPNMPNFEGMTVFKGHQVHSHDYKDFKGFEDKRVVVVGIGNSAVDIACELSHHCSQVYLSTRRGAWVLARLGHGGEPGDHVLSRFTTYALPASMFKSALKNACEEKFDHEHYGLAPEHDVLAQHPTMSDELPVRIICGAVKAKHDIARIHEHDIDFVDGTVEKDIDAIVYCTGYKFGFSFLDSSLVEVKNNKCDLYKYIFPPHLKHPTLAMVGFVQPLGAIMPISEIQSRWITQIFKKMTNLPSEAEMRKDIKRKRDIMAARYVESPRHTIEVDYVTYMDEIAYLVGCKPNIFKMFLTNPSLAFKCVFGPCTPPQFRLQGPHPWEGAREAIESVESNFVAGICGRPVKSAKKGSNITLLLFLGILMIPLAIAIYQTGGDIQGAATNIGTTVSSAFNHAKGLVSSNK